MLFTNKPVSRLSHSFKTITVGLLSPEEILDRSFGEVLKPETIKNYISGNLIVNNTKIIDNYRTLDKWVIGGPNIVEQLFELYKYDELGSIVRKTENKFYLEFLANTIVLDTDIPQVNKYKEIEKNEANFGLIIAEK